MGAQEKAPDVSPYCTPPAPDLEAYADAMELTVEQVLARAQRLPADRQELLHRWFRATGWNILTGDPFFDRMSLERINDEIAGLESDD